MDKKEEINKDRLGKIVELAKRGVGGEKETAIRLVKKICSQYNLNFDDVMNNTNIEKCVLEIKKGDTQLGVQIIARYGHTKYGDQVRERSDGKALLFETTKEKYIEVINAYSILSHKYREEKKILTESFESAFFTKHNLFYQPTDEEFKKMNDESLLNEKKKTKKQIEKEEKERRMAIAVMSGLDDVYIRKQLK